MQAKLAAAALVFVRQPGGGGNRALRLNPIQGPGITAAELSLL